MIFERLNNLAELMEAELGLQKRQLEEKTATLKASVITSVKRALDTGDYSSIGRSAQLDELCRFELAAKSLHDLGGLVYDIKSTLAGDNTAQALMTSTMAKAKGAAAGRKSGHAPIVGANAQSQPVSAGALAATKRRKKAAAKQISEAAKAGLLKVDEMDDASAMDERMHKPGSKAARLRDALNEYLTVDDFREIDWSAIKEKYGFTSSYGTAMARQWALRGLLLHVKLGRRVAYALPAK